MNSYLSLLRRRPYFRYLWLASVVSLAGDWFNTIASVILVNRYTDSGVAVGALFLARALPPFVLGPVAGVLADRFSRKSILVTTDVLRALIVLGFLLVNSAERAWLIYALTIAQFAVSAFFEPAKSALLPGLVDDGDELLAANTLSSATWSAMLTLGAAIGGVMAALFGVRVALIVDSLSFLVSALFIWRVAAPAYRDFMAEPSSGWTDFLDGLRYVKRQPDIGRLTLVKAMAQIGSPDIMIAVYAAQVFPVGEDGAIALGFLYAFAGMGAVLGPILGNIFSGGQARALQQAIGVGFVLVAAGWLLFGWAPSLPIALIAMTLRHMGGSINWTYSSVLLQMKAPDHFLGRVFAFDFGLFTLAMALSVWLTGVALDQTTATPRQIAMVLAAGSLLPAGIWVVANRYYDRARAPQPGQP
jgi:MFS family permease